MTHTLLALVLTLSTDDVRPPARWMPPPKPVMTLTEVVVRGQRFRHDRGSDCCQCAMEILWASVMWDGSYGAYGGAELHSWVGGK